MTEHEKRDRVIKGLQVCVPAGCGREKCPYYDGPESEYWGNPDGYRCEFDLRQDAIGLLKAQEPRVMAREEYVAWVDTPFTERDPVLCERKNKRGSILCWDNLPVCSVEDYGNDVRCWTSRPTDAQREATPWD